jgi:hypothetical protein
MTAKPERKAVLIFSGVFGGGSGVSGRMLSAGRSGRLVSGSRHGYFSRQDYPAGNF